MIRKILTAALLLVASTATAQCVNGQCQMFPPKVMVPQTAMVPQQVLVPQQVQVPYELQGVQTVPPQPPIWVFGQCRQNWLNAVTARRRARRTVPGYSVPIYAPQAIQQQPSQQ